MKRLAIACMAVAAIAAGTSAVAAMPQAQLKDFDCQHAVDPPARGVQVTAVMRTLPGTRKLELRFDLLQRIKGSSRFVAVHGYHLGTWLTPKDPTLGRVPGDTWELTKPVVNLPAPALYRFRVRFRWIGAHGHVIATDVKGSPTCNQPELRPDLLVQWLRIHPPSTAGGSYTYAAVIRNRGATGAGPFDVQLSLGPQTKTVQWLAAHSKRRVAFTGPACASGSYVSVTVDPYGQADQYDRSNDTLAVACP